MKLIISILPFFIVLPPLAYALIAIWCAGRFFGRQSSRDATILQPVTILKPVKGADADSLANFASFCRQEYPCYQIVFAVADAADPAVHVIRQLMAGFPDHDIELVIDGRVFGPNHKVCNLMNAWPMVKHDLIIVCDSDVRVGVQYLKEVCAPFADPGVGLVTSLYRSTGVSGVPGALEGLGLTAEMIPNVMVAMRLEGLSFALGASMAVRREALERIGGFAALVDYLADDYQLGNRVFNAGYRLELSPYFVECFIHQEGLAAVISRQLRWCRTMRVSRPGGYFGSGMVQPALMAILALLVGGPLWGGVAAGLLYAVRFGVVLRFSRCYVRDGLLPRYLWLLPVRDLLACVTWGLAFTGNRVTWRGHRYLIRPGGRMEELG